MIKKLRFTNVRNDLVRNEKVREVKVTNENVRKIKVKNDQVRNEKEVKVNDWVWNEKVRYDRLRLIDDLNTHSKQLFLTNS